MTDQEQKRLKVLVIEDDEGIRQVICEILNLSYFECVPVNEGQAALEYIEKHRDASFLIFVDLVMPGMDGWEFLKQVKSLRKSVKMKLIVITGLQPSKWATAMADADQILEKPFTFKSILEVADRFVADTQKAA